MERGYLAVARVRKPHGLKGEIVVWALTDDPEQVFAPGRALTPIDDEGQPGGRPMTVERSRPYHRHWLLKFCELGDRTAAEHWRQQLMGVPAEELVPPRSDELYVHEVPGAEVVVDDRVIGRAVELLETTGGTLLSVEMGDREILIPFRKPIVRGVDRETRRIAIDPPPGLLEL